MLYNKKSIIILVHSKALGPELFCNGHHLPLEHTPGNVQNIPLTFNQVPIKEHKEGIN